MNGIPVATLPRTIQDAIRVCGEIGLCYLWVDALCIVQDDAEDWRTESSHMAEIYGNSIVTLAALHPDSCMSGFLGPQTFGQPDWQCPIQADVPPALVDSPSRVLFARQGQVPTVRQCALDCRGWCLQERVLPRRRLAFDGSEMSWHCLERTLCECGHLDQDSCREYPELKSGSGAAGGSGARVALNQHRLYRLWTELVDEYSQRLLSKSDDKLVAISGLAKRLRGLLKQPGQPHEERHLIVASDETAVEFACMPLAPTCGPGDYFAGLWKGFFISGLAWSVYHPSLARASRQPHRRYSAYCAPTWSWASVDGPVMLRIPEIQSLMPWRDRDDPKIVCDVTVNDISCIPIAKENPEGALRSARVTLTAPLVAVDLATIYASDDPDWDESPYDREAGLSPSGDLACFVRTRSLRSYRVLLDVEEGLVPIEKGNPKARCWASSRCYCKDGVGCTYDTKTEYSCLRLFTLTKNFVGSVTMCIVVFLVLKRVPETLDTFERVGLGLWNSRKGRSYNSMKRCPQFGVELFSKSATETVNIV